VIILGRRVDVEIDGVESGTRGMMRWVWVEKDRNLEGKG
jgi:hypothetical protein